MRRPAPIAVVTTYYRPVVGGVETAAESLARALVKRGHRVQLVTKRTSTTHPATETLDGVEVRRVGPVGERRSSGKWLSLPAMVLALWARRTSFRLICCVDYRAIGLGALLIGALLGCPVVFETSTEGTMNGDAIRRRLSAIGISADGAAARAATWPIRALYRRADMFVCVSDTLEQELLTCGVPPERIMRLPHTVDRTRFAPVSAGEQRALRTALGLPTDAAIAVFVGRLSREKGVLDLIDAWARVAQPTAHLVIVGPDMTGHPWNVGPAARARVGTQGLAGSVFFAGGVPQEEVARWIQAADVSVQPSHFEAFGIAAAEAMACGLPVVVSDVGGFRDYVVHEGNGLRVPARDVAALSEAMRRLLTDDDLRRRLGSAARIAATQFDEDVTVERHAALLDRLAGLG